MDVSLREKLMPIKRFKRSPWRQRYLVVSLRLVQEITVSTVKSYDTNSQICYYNVISNWLRNVMNLAIE